MRWFEAQNHCQKKGGKLVEIDSEEENTALVDEINRRGYIDRKMHFWIGLTDWESETDWRLASNGLKPAYLNFHEGEPNNLFDEDCALLRVGPDPSWKNTWSDVKCDAQTYWNPDDGWWYPPFSLHALCEFDPPTKTYSAEDTTKKGAS